MTNKILKKGGRARLDAIERKNKRASRAAYETRIQELKNRMAELTAAVDGNFGIDMDDVNFGTVGTLGHILTELDSVQFAIESMAINNGTSARKFFEFSALELDF